MNLKDLPNSQAILIVDDARQDLAESFWNELKDEHSPNIFINKTVVDMDTGRDIISWANTPFSGNKTCIVSFHTITLPAQNSLLKSLEEIKNGVGFILLTSNEEAIIPTVLSRLHRIKKQESRSKNQENTKEFFNAKPTERMKLKFVIELLNKEDEEGRKDREAVKSFISDLIKYGRDNNLESKKLLKLIEMENYAGDPSASGKTILEFLSLYLPKIVNS